MDKLSGEQTGIDKNVNTMLSIVTYSAVSRAQQMAIEATMALRAIGISIADISQFDAMAFAARMTLEKYCALGFLCRSNFTAPYSKQLRSDVQNGVKIPNLEDRKKEAFFLDVALFLEYHFSPIRAMATRLFDTGTLGDDPFEEYLTLRPFSEEANKALKSLDNLNFTNLKTRPVVSDPISIEDLQRELRITEPEAARIARRAPKTLADQRRGGLIPKSVYVQDAEDGTVYYLTQKWLAYVAGEMFGKSKR